MARGSAYLVLPKSSSYDLKSLDEQVQLKAFAEEWYNYLQGTGLKVVCFAEDMLAVRLLHSKDGIVWVHTLGAGDVHFMNTVVNDYPAEYKTLEKTAAKPEIVKAALRKFKTSSMRDYKDEIAYRSARLSILSSRVRFVANEILKDAKYIVYCNNNNNYCNIPEPFNGDGKMIVEASLSKGIAFYTYGGLPVNREIFDTIMRSV